MAIDKTIKSNRLLQSRRYTQAALTDAQEAFTSVLDINSKEIYAQVNLLPTASLPFSGSSQSGSIYATGGQNLLKYWYQHTLTPSNVVSASLVDAWFFIDPSGSSVTPQIIQSGQQTNFISNKYADPSLTNADAQDNPPGYNVVVLVDNVKQNSANYQFDYKDGVLQFNASAPSSAQVVKITAYQYIGQTVDTVLTNLSASIANISGSVGGLSSDKIATSTVTASVSSGSTSFTVVSGSNTLFSVNNAGSISANIKGLTAGLSIDGDTIGTIVLKTTASSGFSITADSSNGFSIYDVNDNNTRFYMNDSGSFGLNTTNVTGYALNVSGSSRFFNNVEITGSLTVNNGITGSLLGTASYATQALSSSFASTASYITSSNVFGPYGADSILSSSFAISSSNAATASYVPASAVVGLNLSQIATGSISASVFINSPTAFNIVSGSTTLLSVNTASVVTVSNLTVSQNLIVNGTASFINSENLLVKDPFILINSGSANLTDSGIISQYNSSGEGSAIYIEASDTGTYGRWAVAYGVQQGFVSVTADEYMVTAKKASGVPPATPTWGGTTNGFGNIYVNSDNGEVFIYT
jgi:hypothetical protein